MNPKQFYQEKSALLTALAASLQTCQRVCEALDRHEAMAPSGSDPDFLAIKDLINDARSATEGLRDAVDVLA